jgi:hypothetical protein
MSCEAQWSLYYHVPKFDKSDKINISKMRLKKIDNLE